MATDILLPPNALTRTNIARQLFDSTVQIRVSHPDRQDFDEYYNMLARDSTARAGVKASTMQFLAFFGQYENEDETRQEFVRRAFDGMQGSFTEALTALSMYSALGVSLVPFEIRAEGTEWLLERLLPLDLRRCQFAGSAGEIEEVIFRARNREERLDYDRVLHLVYDDHLTPTRSPWGLAELKTALAPYKAKRAVLGHALQVAQVAATNNIIIKSDATQVPLYDDAGNLTGESMPRQEYVRRTMEGMQDTGIAVLGLSDVVETLDTASTPEFFEWFVGLLERMQLLSFLVPETQFSVGRGGLGNVTISEQLNATFEQLIRTKVDYVREQLLRCVISPLLAYNFGDGPVGQFVLSQERDEQAVELARTISEAVTLRSLPTVWIPAAQRKLAELLQLNVDLDEELDAVLPPPPFDGEGDGNTAT